VCVSVVGVVCLYVWVGLGNLLFLGLQGFGAAGKLRVQ